MIKLEKFEVILVFIIGGLLYDVSPAAAKIIMMGASFAVALILPQNTNITIGGFANNLAAATLGNVVGGGLFMGLGYWYVSKARSARLSIVKGSQVSIIFE